MSLRRMNICSEDEFDASELIGREVVTTSSEFDFDNVEGRFTRELNYEYDVLVEHIRDDYSEYDPDKCNNGGCYSYHYYRVVEVV